MNITDIAIALIALASAVVTGIVVPLLKAKLDNENNKLTESQLVMLQTFIKTGVYAAEQLFTSAQGSEKKAYVLNLLKEKGYEIDDKALDAAVEAAVKELKVELAK